MYQVGNIIIGAHNDINEVITRASRNTQSYLQIISINDNIMIQLLNGKLFSVTITTPLKKIYIRKLSQNKYRINGNIMDTIELYNELSSYIDDNIDILLLNVNGELIRRIILSNGKYVIINDYDNTLVAYGEVCGKLTSHRLFEFLFGTQTTIYDDIELVVPNRPVIRAIIEYYRDSDAENCVKLYGKTVMTFHINYNTIVEPKELQTILRNFNYEIHINDSITLQKLLELLS